MIFGFTGLTGSGKTLSMVACACRHYKETKRPIYSNFRMGVFEYEGEGWRKKQLFNKDGTPVITWATVLRGNDFIDKLMVTKTGLFLVDEAGFVFNNRKWRELPFELVARFQQSRKLGVDIYYTTQNITRVDMTLRELTHVQVMCEMDTLPFMHEHWRLQNFAYYNPIIGHDSEGNRKLYEAWHEWWFWWQFKKFYQLYDTLEIVDFSLGSDKAKQQASIAKDEVVVEIPPKMKSEPLRNFDKVYHTLDLDGQKDIYTKNGFVVHIQEIDEDHPSLPISN
jgi:hypothetical protein